MPIEIVQTRPVSPEMRRRHGELLNLELGKAKKLQRAGHVKIIGRSFQSERKKKVQRKKSFIKKVEIGAKSKYYIQVMIPYEIGKNVGFAYNREMEKAEDWVLFLDHDVFLTNPYWYEIALNAVDKIGHKGGWFTCYTNRIGCRLQKAPGIDTQSEDIKYHRNYAKHLFNQNRGKIKDVTGVKGSRFSGLFILTHRQAWIDAGGFSEKGFFGIDVDYFTKIKRAGYHVYMLQDLYLYHGYHRETLKPFFLPEGDKL